MRIIGIDFGERRIGVAAADDRTRVAIPGQTVEVSGDPIDYLVRIIEEQHADEVVFGLPISLTGAENQQSARIREVVEALGERVTIAIHFQDERLTTVQADRVTRQPGKPRGKRSTPGNRDSVAAAILLQAYIDGRRPYE